MKLVSLRLNFFHQPPHCLRHFSPVGGKAPPFARPQRQLGYVPRSWGGWGSGSSLRSPPPLRSALPRAGTYVPRAQLFLALLYPGSEGGTVPPTSSLCSLRSRRSSCGLRPPRFARTTLASLVVCSYIRKLLRYAKDSTRDDDDAPNWHNKLLLISDKKDIYSVSVCVLYETDVKCWLDKRNVVCSVN